MTDKLWGWSHVALWLAASALLAFLAMNYLPAALVDGVYIPVGNDAFYHARRILDAAVGERGFYQFDDMIHVPEGSWLTWPWAYDYLMAQSLKLALWVNPDLEPMKFLAYVPVYWTLINTGLFIAIARAAGLPLSLTAIATLAFALGGMTLILHVVGSIDHHFIELTFVQAAVLAGLHFFRERSGRAIAVVFGCVLGMAPAFHNSLFILQIPLILASGILWLKGRSLSTGKASVLAASLTVSCLLFVLPSEPFRDFRFEYATHSWFHLYVTACSSIVLIALSRIRFSKRGLVSMVALGTLLVLPLAFQILYGVYFLQGATIRLDMIEEVKGPLEMYLRAGQSSDVTRYYGWFVVLAPLLIVAYGWQLFVAGSSSRIFFASAAVLGLILLLAQFRLHVFGYWALLLGPFVLAQDLARRRQLPLALVSVAALALVAVAIQPTMKHQHFKNPVPGLSKAYAMAHSLYPILAAECAKSPGIVLSYGDEGHPVRYHTDCSVIVNNFLLTPLHGKKVREADALLDLTPESLLDARPEVAYVFVRLYGVFRETPSGPEPVPPAELAAINSRLFIHLVGREELPDEFEMLGEVRSGDDRDIAVARLFRIDRTRERP